MPMPYQVTSGGVPPGRYATILEAIETMTNRYGPGLLSRFRVTDGEFAGRYVTRATGCTLTPENALGKLVRGLAGRDPQIGEVIDLEQFKGRPFIADVEATESGHSRVAAVWPISSGNVPVPAPTSNGIPPAMAPPPPPTAAPSPTPYKLASWATPPGNIPPAGGATR